MGYTLRIGKAVSVVGDPDYAETGIQWRAEDCEGPPPHTDAWEMTPELGSPTRAPSYTQWHDVLDQLPIFGAFWERLRIWAQDQHADVIPVTEYAGDELDVIEAEALTAPEEAAARALWFVRWSRYALKLYGERAVFETPGEWITWTPAAEYA